MILFPQYPSPELVKIKKYGTLVIFKEGGVFVKVLRSIIVYPLITAFVFSGLSLRLASAQVPVPAFQGPGTLIGFSEPFQPVVLAGLTVDPQHPFEFDFIVDPGSSNLQGDELVAEATRLVRYFLTALTVPEDEQWVNLSPYESDRIIPQQLGFTEFGRQMLAQDYLLKQLTASLLHPDEELGNRFWERVRERVRERYDNVDIDANTFNKVWIVPDRARIVEQGQKVFIVENHFKVMLEQDYVAWQHSQSPEHAEGQDYHAYRQAGHAWQQADRAEPQAGHAWHQEREAAGLSGGEEAITLDVTARAVRELVIPELEKEVNTGKHFAPLRQMFNSMLLATWFKVTLRESVLGQGYANRKKINGTGPQDPTYPERIYQQYLKAYQDGAVDMIREEYDPVTQTIIPRKYFSGGTASTYADAAQLNPDVIEKADPAVLAGLPKVLESLRFKLNGVPDAAMTVQSLTPLLAAALAFGLTISEPVEAGTQLRAQAVQAAEQLTTSQPAVKAFLRDEPVDAIDEQTGEPYPGFLPYPSVTSYADRLTGEGIVKQIAGILAGYERDYWVRASSAFPYDFVMIWVKNEWGERVISRVIVLGKRGHTNQITWNDAQADLPVVPPENTITVDDGGNVSGDERALVQDDQYIISQAGSKGCYLDPPDVFFL